MGSPGMNILDFSLNADLVLQMLESGRKIKIQYLDSRIFKPILKEKYKFNILYNLSKWSKKKLKHQLIIL